MKVCISEFPDDSGRQAAAWEALAEHVAATRPELAVLPEMPFCEWIFVGDAVELAQWGEAVDRHDRMIEPLGELGASCVVSSRPIDHIGRRFNEAYLWSARTGYKALRRKWYLPDPPRARETVWFDQGDRNFRAVPCGPLRFGVQMCSEMMFPEHSRALGLAGAHLVVQPRATGPGKKWTVASEMGAVSSGSYVISTNRRSYARDWFYGDSWLLSPEAAALAETTAEQPFSRRTSTLPWPRSRSPRIRATCRECTSHPPDPDPMDIYHFWFNLKDGVRDAEFAQSVHGYLGHLKEQDSPVGYRITRRKLGRGPPQLPEWNITIEFENLTQMDRAFNRVASRADPVESLHQTVNSKVKDIFFALHREFPDSTRVTGQEKF